MEIKATLSTFCQKCSTSASKFGAYAGAKFSQVGAKLSELTARVSKAAAPHLERVKTFTSEHKGAAIVGAVLAAAVVIWAAIKCISKKEEKAPEMQPADKLPSAGEDAPATA